MTVYADFFTIFDSILFNSQTALGYFSNVPSPRNATVTKNNIYPICSLKKII